MTHSAILPDRIAGLLLAGGLARRMGGGDKCLMALGGQTLLARAIDRLAHQAGPLAISANGDPARFAETGLPVIADPIGNHAGPLAGILAGLNWARANAPECQWIATAATDTPFFPRDLVARLAEGLTGNRETIVIAASGGRAHPVFGLWPLALAGDLDAALTGGTRKVLDWTGRHSTQIVEFGMGSIGGKQVDPFFNINAPGDLDSAKALLGEDKS